MKVLICLMMLTVITGCASTYIGPDSGAVAEVVYRYKSENKNMQVFLYENYDCKKPAMVGTFRAKELDQNLKIKVVANQPLINTYRIVGITTTEFIATEFIPKEGQAYLIFIDEGNFDNSKVLWRNGNNYEVETSQTEPERVCVW